MKYEGDYLQKVKFTHMNHRFVETRESQVASEEKAKFIYISHLTEVCFSWPETRSAWANEEKQIKYLFSILSRQWLIA